MTDISFYFNRLDILNETVQQIEKDFGMSGMEIKFSGTVDNAYEELFSQIHPHIEKLLKASSEKFYNLMYRIDISETKIKKEVAKAKDKSFSAVITDLILNRELQKVIIRKNFSGNT